MLVPGNRDNRKKEQLTDTLMREVANGDRTAFEELYRMTQNSVYCYLLSIVKSHSTAEDLMQDTYLSIRKSIQHYIPQGKPLAWIFTIAKNLAYMELRRVQKQETSDFSDEENQIGVDVISSTVDNLVLKKALEILNEQERKIVLLHVTQGFKFREVSSLLAIPLGTVLSCYNRAIKKLNKAVNESSG
ncbi:RNA polymerase sigma factor [Clostridium sp. D33t1_170424_F3]|uniref:RNA polymerase sigma factor n=1 Tax=Clostridium sp. D33t1_170424_F3 TaxID=2787099 RepID=UPI0018AC2E5C|nr:RNA polymerase sigma factor [Clostridium sp. D33t1_170424_F3]